MAKGKFCLLSSLTGPSAKSWIWTMTMTQMSFKIAHKANRLESQKLLLLERQLSPSHYLEIRVSHKKPRKKNLKVLLLLAEKSTISGNNSKINCLGAIHLLTTRNETSSGAALI